MPRQVSFRRAAARALLGAAALLGGLACALWLPLGAQRPRAAEFLFLPRQTASSPPAPEPVAPTPAPTPSKMEPATPPPTPTLDERLVTVTLPPTMHWRAQTPDQFVITSMDPSVTLEIVRVEPIEQKKRVKQSAQTVYGALLVDQSGSTRLTDPVNLRIQAIKQLVQSVPQAHFGLFVFGESVEAVPGSQRVAFRAPREMLQQAIDELPRTVGGSTPLFAGLRNTIQTLVQEAPPKASKVVLCFTDGIAEDSHLQSQVLQEAQRHSVQIYFVALGAGTDWSLYRQLAQATGGQLFPVDEPRRLTDAFAQLAGRVVELSQTRYRLHVRAIRTNSTWTSGEQVRFTVRDTVSGDSANLTVSLP